VSVATTAHFNVWFNATLGGIITGTPTYHISGRVEGQSYACDTNAVIHFGVAHLGVLSAGSASHGCQATPP
jgi:hypothetical protein